MLYLIRDSYSDIGRDGWKAACRALGLRQGVDGVEMQRAEAPSRTRRRCSLALLATALAFTCLVSVTGRAEAGVTPRGSISGVVEGNGAPQGGYTVSLYASRGGGAPHTSVVATDALLGTDTTDAAGGFEIDYVLPQALWSDLGPVLYVVAEKDTSMLASAIGNASGLVVNERTTVAMATAFAQFVFGRTIGGNTYGVLNAVKMAANMADPRTGLLGAVLDNEPNAGLTSTRGTFNSLANIVASCVAAAPNCQTLFDEATPPGGPAPTTVLQALANMTKYPSNNVDELFALGDGGPFTPALAGAPTSWLLFIKFTGGFYSDYQPSNLMGGPGQVAIDGRGFAWINDNYEPTEFLGRGCTGLRLLKFYPWGESFPGSPYFGGGLSGAGFGITLDPRGDVWIGNFGFESPACADGTVPPDPARKIPATHDSVSLFRPDGLPVSPFEGFTNGGIWWPQATMSDRQGNIWVANCGNDTVTFIPRGDPTLARNIPLPGGQGEAGNLRVMLPDEPLLKPFAITIDPRGRAWVTGDKAQELYIVQSDGTVETVESNGLLSWPLGVVGDSRGNMWVSSSGAIDLPCGGTPLSPSAGTASVVLFPADGSPPQQFTGGGISIPWGSAVDGNDTVWIFNFGRNPLDGGGPFAPTPVSHFCGADASKCPAGLSAGDPISPSTGYQSDALDRITGGGVDPSGNLWLLNNWKKTGPLLYNFNPGGNSFVIVPGAAKPIRTPLIGPPVPFEATPQALDVPGTPCDPLYAACGAETGQPATTEPTPQAPAPEAGGDGAPAVGHARTPNLRTRVAATWENGRIRVTVRVLTSKPKLVNRWFLVRVRIPSLDKTAIVRVRPNDKQVRILQLTFAGPASAIGTRVVATVDPTKRILETRERDNSASARIGA